MSQLSSTTAAASNGGAHIVNGLGEDVGLDESGNLLVDLADLLQRNDNEDGLVVTRLLPLDALNDG